MFNSKDIYDPEWLDLVFENRNKNYGAYELRKTYASTMVRSLAITITAISAMFAIGMLLFNDKVKAITTQKTTQINNKNIRVITDAANNQTNSPLSKPSTRQAAYCGSVTNASLRAHAFSAKIPAADKPSPAFVNTTIATNIDVQTTIAAVAPETPEMESVDVKPTPVGGAQEWSQFLETNLRYPAEAKQQHISGRPVLTFVVERNGHITNINIDQSAGHGFDEEAMRVLKLSPPWTPAMLNGQTVRVKYRLPVNFYMVR